jgi:hypothetical protein
MLRVLVAAFLTAHGLVHLAIYAAPRDPRDDPPFDPYRSWALDTMGVALPIARTVSIAWSWFVAVGSVLAAVGLLASVSWWAACAATFALVAAMLKIVYFNPWMVVGILIDLGIVLAVANEWPASLY